MTAPRTTNTDTSEQTRSDAFEKLGLNLEERIMMNHLTDLVAHIRSTGTRIAITDIMFAQSRPRSLFRRSYDAPSWLETQSKVVALINSLPSIDYNTRPNGYTIRELIHAYPALRQLRDAALQTPGVPKYSSLRYDTSTALRLLKRLYRSSDYTRLS